MAHKGTYGGKPPTSTQRKKAKAGHKRKKTPSGGMKRRKR